MTERGLPIVDAPVACPFVAFVDDRDERATSPDHRHRCYAEATPAPRALAHQEAYCLSSAFPVCPTFQDWARREAARARAGDGEATAGHPIPGLSDERPDGADDEPVYEDRPRKSTHRNWASPPPWAGGAGQGRDPRAAADDGDAAAGAAGAASTGQAATGAAAGGLAGSFADRLASPAEAARQRKPVFDDRWDDEVETEPPPAADDVEDDDEGERGAAIAGTGAAMAGTGAAMAAAGPEPPHGAAPPPRRRDRSDTGGGDDGGHDAGRDRTTAPSWERPARLETYPTLRSRRLPQLALPSIVLAAIAVVLAAVLLFFLPGLLGLGGQQAASSPSPSTAASAAPASVEPTAVPAPTQQIYIVQSGDTMSKIAKKFHVPLQALIDANKTTVPNPDKLKIGDQVIIPVVTPSELPSTSPAASP